MALQAVGLLDLAAIWEANIVDAKVAVVIIRVGRYLACTKLGLLKVRSGRLGNSSPQYREMTLMSVRRVTLVLCLFDFKLGAANAWPAKAAKAIERRLGIRRR